MASSASKEASQIFSRAHEGFLTWSKVPLAKRAELLLKFAKALEAKKDTLAEIISEEIGKPLWDSKNEVKSAIDKIQISIDSFRLRCPENIRALPQGRLITRHKAHGCALVLGPFNFPLHLPNGHIIPALLAGNSVVFKPSELAPQTAKFYAEMAHKAGIPEKVLSIAPADLKMAEALLDEPFRLVLFTGSVQVGKKLLAHFSSKPEVILALEMGGNNPLIIGEISDVHAASYQTIQSTYLTSGQRCTAARRLIVPKGKMGDAFLKELEQMILKIKVGHWQDKPEPYMGPVVSVAAADNIVRTWNDLVEKGGVVICPLKRSSQDPKLLTPGLIDVTSIKTLPDEECFGPLLQLIRVENFEAAIKTANQTQFGLAASLFSDSPEEYEAFFEGIHAGVVNWNVPTTGASSYAPFGGVGLSGNGHPSAFYAADYAAYPVASIETPSLKIPASLPPGLQGVKP
jgi:succinylglutamic semialdehyde dehydrogenase